MCVKEKGFLLGCKVPQNGNRNGAAGMMVVMMRRLSGRMTLHLNEERRRKDGKS